VKTLPFWFAFSGVFSAWFVVIIAPQLRAWLMRRFSWVYRLLVDQYGFDIFNDVVLTRGTRKISEFFFNVGDLKVLDHYIVDGSGRNMTRMSKFVRRMQTGYLYHYAFVMIIGLLGFMVWLIW